jgi:hypothetical protein
MNMILNCFYRTYGLFFWCKRKYIEVFEVDTDDQHVFVSPTHLPWLWIGAELEDGKILSITEDVNDEVRYGDRVNEDYLVDVTRLFNVKRWLYLDPQTLKEEEIPLEGLVIENDPYKSKTE